MFNYCNHTYIFSFLLYATHKLGKGKESKEKKNCRLRSIFALVITANIVMTTFFPEVRVIETATSE